MILKIGDKIKVTYKRGHGQHVIKRDKIGKIIYLNNRLITVKFKNYKTSFNVSDVVAPINIVLKVRRNKQWMDIQKEWF